MYRTRTCGDLRLADEGLVITLAGWVQKTRKMGGMTFVDIRDRYGITQLVFNQEVDAALCEKANKLGREYVIQVTGTVRERSSKNPNIPTGEIEIIVSELNVLNAAVTPPFTIEDDTDGGDDLRMKYRYLDLRREPLQKNLMMRHEIAKAAREYFYANGFTEIETPMMIKSTPEGARDYIVPSRIHNGKFYALPQSPQMYKQLLMIAGMDRYIQLARCFRDEDLRADRQPEFTQIDCEMSFVEQEDVLEIFERFAKYLFRETLGIEFGSAFPRIPWSEAMARYGSDKPDIRFGMEINDLSDRARGRGFAVFDSAEYVGGIVATGCAGYTRKQIDELTEFVKRPQVGAKGLVWIRLAEDGSVKSSIDKFFPAEELLAWAAACGAAAGDLLLRAGDRMKTLAALNVLRLEMGDRLGLRDPGKFAPLWVVDFPLLEWDEETKRFYAMHHPFTSPKPEDIPLFDTDPAKIRANAYDFVVNGTEVGGGSIRIFDSGLQSRLFETLGFSHEDAEKQFGFLMNAFKYGAPPHGGIAFGFDRFCSLFGGADSIRDFIAFPKNNAGRDVMVDAPAPIADTQLDELALRVAVPEQ